MVHDMVEEHTVSFGLLVSHIFSFYCAPHEVRRCTVRFRYVVR